MNQFLTYRHIMHVYDENPAMDALAVSLPPEELNRVGVRLYERFRAELPAGAQGWGAKGVLHVVSVLDVADR